MAGLLERVIGCRVRRDRLQVQLKVKTSEEFRQSRNRGLPTRAFNGVYHRAGHTGSTGELTLRNSSANPNTGYKSTGLSFLILHWH
jgi:hypothetical protein